MRIEPLSKKTIALSISDSGELGPLGLSMRHLEDAMIDIARHLLALGAKIAYGGDLRPGGYTEALHEVALTYRKDDFSTDDHLGLSCYIAWPILANYTSEQIQQLDENLRGFVEIIPVDNLGRRKDLKSLLKECLPDPSENVWSIALSRMRTLMSKDCDARVALGGQTTGFKGAFPGIAEELIMQMSTRKPVYILGGFGGCSRDFANFVINGDRPEWLPDIFPSYSLEDLNNGLTREENITLLNTPFIDQAITLIIHGLTNSNLE